MTTLHVVRTWTFRSLFSLLSPEGRSLKKSRTAALSKFTETSTKQYQHNLSVHFAYGLVAHKHFENFNIYIQFLSNVIQPYRMVAYRL